MLARFNQKAQMQGSPVRVNREAGAATAWRGDQPSVAVASDGAVYVLWTARVDAGDKHGTDIYLSASTDRGQSFTNEVKVNDDKAPGPHGMHSLAVAASMPLGLMKEMSTRQNLPRRLKDITWRATAIYMSLTRRTAAALFPRTAKLLPTRVLVVRRHSLFLLTERCTRVGARCCPVIIVTSQSRARPMAERSFQRP
jgi:hypothetical protein